MQAVFKNPHWRPACTTVGRWLALLSVFACIAATNQMPQVEAEQKNVCQSPECFETASSVLGKMKREIKPCDDFYKFACGSYIERTRLSEDKAASATFSVLSEKVLEQLQDILTEERHKTDPNYLKLPHLFYKACMNTCLIKALDDKPIQQIIDSLGGWPLLVGESWDSNNTWTWQETVKKFRRLGLNSNLLVEFDIEPDVKNLTKLIITLDQFNRDMDISLYSSKRYGKLIYKNMVDVAVLFGAKREVAESELKDVFEFLLKLARISLSDDRKQNLSDIYNLHTIKQLQESYPYVQWLDYINALLPPGLEVNENEVVNVVTPSYFANLTKLLQSTNKRIIANYMMMDAYINSLEYLSKKFQKMQGSGFIVRPLLPRWKKCVHDVSASFDPLVTSLYVGKYLNQDSKAVALKMVNNIRNVFSKTLDKVEWMDAKTKEEAKRKLHAMQYKIGYSGEMLENNYLDDLEIEPDKYFEGMLKANVFLTDYKFNKLKMPLERKDKPTYASPEKADGYYIKYFNDLVISAGALQEHFVNAKLPMYMNYGALGFFIGHQITRGFDNDGRTFDSKGDLHDFWTADTEQKFLEKSKCIIEQYKNYSSDWLTSVVTRDANIADNGGIKLSYLAYKQWTARKGEEPMLPGVNYTSNQMFWISAAQSLCDKFEKDLTKAAPFLETTFPNRIRIFNSLRNSKDFARDFQCPTDSTMNSQDKCEIW